MRQALGLRGRVVATMALALLVVLGLVAGLWYRQEAMQREVEGLSGETMRTLVGDSLKRRGEGAVVQLADALTNPLYYFDLDAIGELARGALRQPDVEYVLVFDVDGNVIHDGSAAIPGYGTRMDDPLAYEAVSARKLHVQWSEGLMDVSSPLMLGDQRLGGVRIGYSLDAVRAAHGQALGGMRQRLEAVGGVQLAWIAALGLALLVLGALLVWAVQRTLVAPVRQLADAARQIEAGNYDGPIPDSSRNDEIGDLMRAFGRMSTSVARHDRDIRRMAYTDALTGLSNRLAFREQLDQRLLQLGGASRQVALLFADIDDFKRINDTLGHDAGDQVLLQFASRIRESVTRIGGGDALLARFGGDEFVVLVDDGPGREDIRETATRLAETLVQELGRPIALQDRQVFLGTSIGVTLFPEDAASATMLMKNGDIAMYQAKVAGKNCHRFYSRAMDQAVERRVRLEHELRGAWDRGELTLAYQPLFRLADRRLVGAEALLRWDHPEYGQIAPSVFIDVAEQSGLIETIGPQVLRVACSDAVHWERSLRDGDPLFVSVNVSPRQLRSGDLPQIVANCLLETGLDASRLHLELTETAVIGDEAHAHAMLTRLRDTGVKVWLDDFGTGFSGLSHLRRVPVDGVKIDRSFVADVLRDPDDLALTTAIIAMAHSLAITVVAEGVEKEGQYAILRERGCDLAQGYWLGHPMGAEAFAHLL